MRPRENTAYTFIVSRSAAKCLEMCSKRDNNKSVFWERSHLSIKRLSIFLFAHIALYTFSIAHRTIAYKHYCTHVILHTRCKVCITYNKLHTWPYCIYDDVTHSTLYTRSHHDICTHANNEVYNCTILHEFATFCL